MKQEIVENGEPSDYRAIKRQLQADIDYRLLGQHMQEVRHSRKMTQAAVAEKMKVGVKYYSAIESGKAKINLYRLIQFICIMGTSADHLLVGCHLDYYPLVEDCVQDAFLQAVIDYDEYKDYKNPIGWIVRVAQNKVKSKFRDELRHAKVVSTLLPGQSEDMAFSVCAVEEELARRDTIEQIVRIYSRLTDHEKKVFISYFLNDMSQKETAEFTGLTENSVRAAVKRIRKRARSMKKIDFLLFLGAFYVTLVTRR